MFTVTSAKHNPVLSPRKNYPWESVATFNPSPIVFEGKKHLLYRAMSHVDRMIGPLFKMSVIGCARSDDGKNFEERTVLIRPEEEYDKFGVEDPRVTKIDEMHYIFYTALGGFPFSADNIKVAVALSRDLVTIEERHLVTPFNAKAMCLFSEKINGEYVAILSVNTDRAPSDICIARFKNIEDMWSSDYWNKWYANLDDHKINIRRNSYDKVEVGAIPFKTDKGWLMIYSHIQAYGTDAPVFGVEAVLLDLLDPRNIITRTDGPFMVPEEYYEKIGIISNVVFPTGALVHDDTIELYYGASDTHSAVAYISLSYLLNSMIDPQKFIHRYKHNPILMPRAGYEWEEGGVFNPAAIEIKGITYILYRAVTKRNVSTIGLAISKDGFSINERLELPIYKGRAKFETLEADSSFGNPSELDHDRGPYAGSNHGTEDPRIVQIGEKLYMTYTGYNGKIPRVVLSSISVNDFIARNFEAWGEPTVITPETIDDKDVCIFPEKINGQYLVFHRIGENICADTIESIDYPKPLSKCIDIIGPRRGMWDGSKVGIATPPIKTKEGWILLYHGVSIDKIYSVGALLLDLVDPTIIKSRTALPIFNPTTSYEVQGVVARVIFPCGIIVEKEYLNNGMFVNDIDGTQDKYLSNNHVVKDQKQSDQIPNNQITNNEATNTQITSSKISDDQTNPSTLDNARIYYGGADYVTAVATCNISDILSMLLPILE